MSRSLVLNTSASVTLDGSGNGQASTGPSGVAQSWQVARVATSTSSAQNPLTAVPIFQVYTNYVAQSQFLGGSLSGSLDVDDTINVTLFSGQQIIGVWSGGNPGDKATMSIYGSQQVPA